MSARTFSRAAARGYTIIELVMSLSVLAIGATGVIAMQKVAIASNRHAKELAIAGRIAEGWADQLTLDGTLWTINTAGATTIGSTTWLNLANPSQTVEWFTPTHNALRNFGPGFGTLGNPVDPAQSPQLVRYCTQLRFSYLHSAIAPTLGKGVIRAQIRIFWPTEDSATSIPSGAGGNLCGVNAAALTNNIGAFHVIYLTTSVAQAPKGLL